MHTRTIYHLAAKARTAEILRKQWRGNTLADWLHAGPTTNKRVKATYSLTSPLSSSALRNPTESYTQKEEALSDWESSDIRALVAQFLLLLLK